MIESRKLNAIETSANTLGKATEIRKIGATAVGVYLRADRCSVAMIKELHEDGLKVWSTWEKGYPDHYAYFSQAQGTIDGAAAAKYARQVLNQPAGTLIYATVDYDADGNNPCGPTINGRISNYMIAFKTEISSAGYEAGVYGSGRTCRILIAKGFAKSGWLTEFRGFAEYAEFAPRASIVQLYTIDNHWDADYLQNPDGAGVW